MIKYWVTYRYRNFINVVSYFLYTWYTGQPGIRSRFAQLTVIVPSDAPVIAQGDFLLVTENHEIDVECVSVGGKPAADVSVHKYYQKNTFPIIHRYSCSHSLSLSLLLSSIIFIISLMGWWSWSLLYYGIYIAPTYILSAHQISYHYSCIVCVRSFT